MKTPITASGSRAASTAAPRPTAASVSRPIGSPRNCRRSSPGTAVRIACLVLLAGTDVAIAGGYQALQPIKRQFEQALAVDEGDQLLGASARLMGHSRVPEPPARIKAYRIG